MIILKHLTVEHFRLLREINLHFPQRGSILIQGPNEAGKSALLESIYFALYGEPIISNASERGRRTLDELVFYGASQATVTLTVSIGATEMTITRSIERERGQHATVQVRRLGMPDEEPITRLATANERIITELGHMDGETLRNSCFIEQKGLDRLEDLAGSEREATIRKLLGLEKLLRLTEQFKVTPNDERMLLESTERLKLAEIQARIPELSRQLGQIEAALDAVTISEDLAEIQQQEEDIAEQQLSLQQLRMKRAELKGHLNRMQHLQKADSTLREIITAYDAIAEARRELPELDQQIAELERREREELPALEKRVSELSDLIRSFGTLERMSNDLLTTISTLKHFEQELKEHQAQGRNNDELDEEIITTRLQVEQTRQSQQEIEERAQASRPQLEARLQRLQELSKQLTALHQAEEEHAQLGNAHRSVEVGMLQDGEGAFGSPLVNPRGSSLEQDIEEADQKLFRAEAEAKQLEQQAGALEKLWRQLSIGRKLEEWQRVKGQSRDLQDAEHQVMAAYQNQERLTLTAVETRQTANRWLMAGIGSGVLGLILGVSAFFSVSLLGIFLAATLGLLAFLSLLGAGWSWYQYARAHKDAQRAHQQMQEAINQVGRMVAARELAVRTSGGTRDALAQVEQEIRSLEGTIPRSREEAQYLLQQLQDSIGTQFNALSEGKPGENLHDVAAVQQWFAEKRKNALAARDKANAKMEALSVLHQQWKSAGDQFTAPGGVGADTSQSEEDSEIALQATQDAIQNWQREIVLLAGREGLPIPVFDTPLEPSTSSPGGLQELQTALVETIKATEQEIASLDAGQAIAAEYAAQVKTYQEALDKLLARRREIIEHDEKVIGALSGVWSGTPYPGDRYGSQESQGGLDSLASHRVEVELARQIERTREQQLALRTALQSLQDSLRERVKPLGVAFGQAAVSNAEAIARKQLEALRITLDNRIELQSRRTNFATVLKERQDSLSEHYNQLAKFSSSLGSWVVPPNPFAETLGALRTRCQQEIQDADESSILQKLEKLQLQERASLAKVELCRQEIEEAQDRIAAMLVQRNRPPAKGYSAAEIAAVWPLVGEYTSEDRAHLTEEHALLEEELQQQEQQELELSARLNTGGKRLDLQQARLRKEQQERSYQTRKRGSLLVNAASERLLRRMLPRTEYYMQQILPLLTSGRYHDVRLATKPVGAEEDLSGEGTLAIAQTASGGAFQLHVWDTGASAYLAKSQLSGGAADQLSLALRLAFAIAVLPRELAAAPGFLLLDEPLSSFDRARTQALVDVITGEILGQHFEQVLLVSHSNAFDPSMFPYHIYLDAGVIVESNLPVVPALQMTQSNGYSKNSNGGADVPADPVTPLPASIVMES